MAGTRAAAIIAHGERSVVENDRRSFNGSLRTAGAAKPRGSIAMKLPRRQFLHLAAGAAALPVLPSLAHALDYPTRPVHIVVGYAAGLSPDIVARLVGESLSERFGQQFVIDNRPGGASNIGTEIVAKAPPDGYTLLIVVSTNAINATLYRNLNFDFARDLVPVAGIGRTPFILTVNPAVPAKTIPEFIAYAKANPGRLNMASSGVGTGPHVSGELFKMLTGVEWVHVPYRVNNTSDLLAGQVQLAFPPIAQVLGYLRDGRLRALGVTPAARSATLPDVPTIAEYVPGYEASGWYGICAPAGTPAEIIAKLSANIAASVADPKLQARLSALGIETRPMATAEFAKFIADETEKWAKVIKFAAIPPQ
jgi:tripartite-type tricarboxylate transporter receptor subunit TctC